MFEELNKVDDYNNQLYKIKTNISETIENNKEVISHLVDDYNNQLPKIKSSNSEYNDNKNVISDVVVDLKTKIK